MQKRSCNRWKVPWQFGDIWGLFFGWNTSITTGLVSAKHVMVIALRSNLHLGILQIILFLTLRSIQCLWPAKERRWACWSLSSRAHRSPEGTTCRSEGTLFSGFSVWNQHDQLESKLSIYTSGRSVDPRKFPVGPSAPSGGVVREANRSVEEDMQLEDQSTNWPNTQCKLRSVANR